MTLRIVCLFVGRKILLQLGDVDMSELIMKQEELK